MADKNHNPQFVQEEKIVKVPKPDHVKPQLMAFVPLIVALVSLISTFLTTVKGWEVLPFTSQEVEQFVSLIITVISTIWAWFRNNNVTKQGIMRESVADQAVPKKNKKPIKEG